MTNTNTLNLDLENINNILEKGKKELEAAAASSLENEIKTEAAKKLAIEKELAAQKVQAEADATKKKQLELEQAAEKEKAEKAAQAAKEQAAKDAAKKQTLDELAKAELELKLKEKDEELKAVSERLQVIENERKARQEQAHYDKVNILVNKMVQAGFVDKESAQKKFESLHVLDEDALGEVYSIVDARLKTKAEEEPVKKTVPSQQLKDNDQREKQKDPTANMSPIEVAFAKLQQKKMSGI